MTAERTRSKHDAAVRAIADIYKRHDFWTCINPGGQRNCQWNGLYMDVIVASETPPESALVIEVETADSVSVEEARDQWSIYDETFDVWTLALPSTAREKARRLLSGFGLQNCGTLITWRRDADGGLVFTGLPGIK